MQAPASSMHSGDPPGGDLRRVEHDGDTWRVLSAGVERSDGLRLCHLASTTRFLAQRNGQRPIQICDWIRL